MVQILASQETRIKELEAKLSELQQGSGADIEHTSRNGLLDHSLADPNVNRLIITMNAASNQKFPLTQNIMTIGRDPQNDIQIRSRYISRFHARIVSDHEGSVIEDLDSQNGVNVNACKATRKRLSSGDLIDLGRIQLKFIDLMELSSSEGQA
jgi:pSer/pThr/pTyr-binding forkhead associated (FHA) protein